MTGELETAIAVVMAGSPIGYLTPGRLGAGANAAVRPSARGENARERQRRTLAELEGRSVDPSAQCLPAGSRAARLIAGAAPTEAGAAGTPTAATPRTETLMEPEPEGAAARGRAVRVQLFGPDASAAADDPLASLERLLWGSLGNRDGLASACLDPPQSVRLPMAKACVDIATGLLEGATHRADAPRALEWALHALDLGAPAGEAPRSSEKPLRDRTAYLKAWALEEMGYLAAARAGFQVLAQDPASVEREEATRMTEKVAKQQEKIHRHHQSGNSGSKLYTKGAAEELQRAGLPIDGNSPVKVIPGVTPAFIMKHKEFPGTSRSGVAREHKRGRGCSCAAEYTQEADTRRICEGLFGIRPASV